MNPLFANLLRRLGYAPISQQRAAPVTIRTSGRPTYTNSLAGAALLSRPESFQLLTEYAKSIPLVSRSIDILSGFVGTPEFTADDQRLAEDLNLWAKTVRYGDIGRGLGPWIPDHLGQSLLYGFGIGELETAARRDGVTRLWSYKSPAFGFRSDPAGRLEIVQQQNTRGLQALHPETVLHTVYSPEGCDPHGVSLFSPCHRFCQGLLDAFHAHNATWKRIGQPIFQVAWIPPASFNDPTGAIMGQVRAALETSWNQAMKSQAVDGVAMDFFSAGDVNVKAIGTDGMEMDITISARAFAEEVIAATGIPPFMFGLSWSTTERMSSVQADMLVTTIAALRAMIEGTLRKVVDTHLRLIGRAGASWQLVWPDISLLDIEATARAASLEAQAQTQRLKFGLGMVAAGIWNQLDLAEFLTGAKKAAVPLRMEELAPLYAGGAAPADTAPAEMRALRLREMGDEYKGLFAHSCNGKH
jgi:hypothetical protein